MIKVLHIVAALDAGGVENLLYQYYQHMKRQEFQFDFIVHHPTKGVLEEAFEAMGATIYRVPSKHENIVENVKAMRQIIQQGNYDIVHCHQDAISAIPLYLAKRLGIKHRIAHAHNVYTDESWKLKVRNTLLRYVLKRSANSYCACSVAAGEWLFRKKFLKKNKLILIKNAININKFKFDAGIRNHMRQVNQLEDKIVIGHVGRFTEQKNHMFLLEVFKETFVREPKAMLLLIGDGELKKNIVERAKKLGIDKQIKFLGKQDNVANWMQAMDVFVLPSLYEGLGIVLIEAQATGLSCIASNQVPAEAKLTSKVKFLSLSDPKEKWAEEILKSLSSERNGEKQTLQEAGYDIEMAVKELESLYRTDKG